MWRTQLGPPNLLGNADLAEEYLSKTPDEGTLALHVDVAEVIAVELHVGRIESDGAETTDRSASRPRTSVTNVETGSSDLMALPLSGCP